MNLWLFRECCRVSSPLLRQPIGLTYTSVISSSTPRQFSTTSSITSTSFSRINFAQPKHARLREWQFQDAQRSRENLWGDLMQHTPSKGTGGPSSSADELWLRRHEMGYSNILAPNNAYTGRSMAVSNDDQGNGVAEAWSKLSLRLKRNNVYAEFKRNMRHEKKGVKRRRLESERWRRRFAHEVRKKVQLVNAIRKRGA